MRPVPSWPDKPWLTIWVAPRGTMRRILDSDPTRHVLLLAAMYGMSISFVPRGNIFGNFLPVWAVLLLAFTAGPLVGIIAIYISGAIFRWSGSVLGGRATTEEVRAAFAWSSVPQILSVVLWLLPGFALYGTEIITGAGPRMAGNPLPLLLGLVPRLILAFWGEFLQIKTLAEAHQFSAWRSLAALFLALLIIFMPLFLLLLLLVGLRP